jgi:hypothetical protein
MNTEPRKRTLAFFLITILFVVFSYCTTRVTAQLVSSGALPPAPFLDTTPE